MYCLLMVNRPEKAVDEQILACTRKVESKDKLRQAEQLDFKAFLTATGKLKVKISCDRLNHWI